MQHWYIKIYPPPNRGGYLCTKLNSCWKTAAIPNRQREASDKKGCVICAKPGQIRHTDLPLEKFYTLADPCELKTAFRALIAANVLPNCDQGIGTAAKFLEILSLLFKDRRISVGPLRTGTDIPA